MNHSSIDTLLNLKTVGGLVVARVIVSARDPNVIEYYLYTSKGAPMRFDARSLWSVGGHLEQCHSFENFDASSQGLLREWAKLSPPPKRRSSGVSP